MRKNILITGGAGFIGSHLARELVQSGHHVRVLDKLTEQVHGVDKSREAHARELLGEDIDFRRGDVRSASDLSEALEGIDVVYHFAASVGVGQSMYEIEPYVDNNNRGTATLLQLLIDQPVKRLVVASSMSIYGEGLYQNAHGRVYLEVQRDVDRLRFQDWEPRSGDGEPLRPIPTPETKRPDLASIYALSKFDQERMCLLIGRAYHIPTVALRFFNVYGPGQALSNPYTGVMAIFGARLLNDQPPMIFEDGNQLRDLVHVSDVTRACRLALEVDHASGHALNIGSGEQYTVREIAERMAKALGKEHIAPEITNKYRVGDVRHCFADISHARQLLGFEPQVKFEEGLKNLVGWLSAQHAQSRAEDKTHQMRDELMTRGLAV